MKVFFIFQNEWKCSGKWVKKVLAIIWKITRVYCKIYIYKIFGQHLAALRDYSCSEHRNYSWQGWWNIRFWELNSNRVLQGKCAIHCTIAQAPIANNFIHFLLPDVHMFCIYESVEMILNTKGNKRILKLLFHSLSMINYIIYLRICFCLYWCHTKVCSRLTPGLCSGITSGRPYRFPELILVWICARKVPYSWYYLFSLISLVWEDRNIKMTSTNF